LISDSMKLGGRARSFLLLAALLTAACAGDEAGAGGSAGSSAAAAAVPAPPRNVCTMITAQELQAATSLSGQGQSSRSGSADVCTWLAGEAAAIVQVHGSAVEYDTARAAFQELYGGTALDVAGIGDRAFYIEGKTSNIATSTLTSQRGATPVTVQILGGADSTRRRRVEALARLAVGKL
jgi:hypothetical protein